MLCTVSIIYYFMPQLIGLSRNLLSKIPISGPKEEYVEFPFTYVKDVEGNKFEVTILTFKRIEPLVWSGDYQVLATFKHLGHRAITLQDTLSVHFELYTSRGNYYESYLTRWGWWISYEVRTCSPEEEGDGHIEFNTREDEYPLTLKVLEKDAIYIFKIGPGLLLRTSLIETEIFRLINEEREKHDLPILKHSDWLYRLAKSWSEYLAKNKSKENIGFGDIEERKKAAIVPDWVRISSEIIDFHNLNDIPLKEYDLKSETFLAGFFVNEWLNSERCSDIILQPYGGEMAIGVSLDDEDVYVVADFLAVEQD